MEKVVIYRRVSTKEQSSGNALGLSSQQEALNKYIADNGLELVGEFVEVASGTVDNREELNAALELCRVKKARLLIHSLSRLSRKVAYVAKLIDSGIAFTALDFPHADAFQLHIMSAVAQNEAKLVSTRTKAALAVLKKTKRLGLANPCRTDVQEVAAKGRAAREEKANKFAMTMKSVIRSFRMDGHNTFAALAAALTASPYMTARGANSWHPSSIRVLEQRIARLGSLSP